MQGALDAKAEAIEVWSDALVMLGADLDFSVDLRADVGLHQPEVASHRRRDQCRCGPLTDACSGCGHL